MRASHDPLYFFIIIVFLFLSDPFRDKAAAAAAADSLVFQFETAELPTYMSIIQQLSKIFTCKMPPSSQAGNRLSCWKKISPF